MKLRTLSAVAAATLVPIQFSCADAPVPGKLTPATAEVKSARGEQTTLSYLTGLPQGEAPKEGWPLLIFLHGSGERGSDLEMLKQHGPPKLFGTKTELDSFLTIAPQCPASSRGWDTTALKDLMDQTIASQPVDKSRIYLSGLSMGGYGAWKLLKENPDFFAAAIPICGGGDPASASLFKDVPIWIFHGRKDEAVPVQKSIDMDEALKKAGGKPKFTLYEDAPHDCWTRTFENPEVYSWLLLQKKS